MLFIPLIISIILLCISIYIELNIYKSSKSKEFILSLDTIEQENIYKRYVSERLILYFQGQIIGFIIAIIFSLFLKNYNILIFSIIIYLSSLLFMILYPKKIHMIDNLTSQNQNILWRQFQQEKKIKNYITSILNIFSFCIIGKLIKDYL